jgi:hypothetical protein
MRALERFIRRAWSVRDDRYSELRHLNNDKGAGQEMYRMGG